MINRFLTVIYAVIAVWWGLFLVFNLTGCGSSDGTPPVIPPPPPPITISRKPSVFQAWNGITGEPSDDNLAKHDLAWLPIVWTGFQWDGDLHSSTLIPFVGGPYDINHVRQLNPGIKVLVSIAHYEAEILKPDPLPWERGEALDTNDPWWLLVNGQKVAAWPGGTTYQLNQSNPDLQDLVAARAKAVCDAGLDGVMLDTFNEFKDPVNLNAIASKVRAAIGPGKLIIINSNTNKDSVALLGLVNGVFMENGALGTPGRPTLNDALLVLYYNEAHVRSPKHNCFEDFRTVQSNPDDPGDMARMTATVTAVTKHSNAHVLFAHNNTWVEADHSHEWYPIYDQVL